MIMEHFLTFNFIFLRGAGQFNECVALCNTVLAHTKLKPASSVFPIITLKGKIHDSQTLLNKKRPMHFISLSCALVKCLYMSSFT